MAEEKNQGTDRTDEVDQAMGEAEGDTLKVPAGAEDEPVGRDLPEGDQPGSE